MVLDRIAQNLADIGAVSLEDFLADIPTQVHSDPDVNPVARLHQVCQQVFRSSDPLKFEFIEQTGSRNKQCILTITRPGGTHRSYATQPIFTKKSEAKLEAAKIAIDMGALDFLATAPGGTSGAREISSAASDGMSVQSSETSIDDVEKCCVEWRAGRVTPRWVPFYDPKLQRQGCALAIRLSPHVVRVYLVDPTFDTSSDAKEACAKVAVSQGVLDFIKYGNGQTRPPSPDLSAPSTTSLPSTTTPWTLQCFYDSLPRPFPESFTTNDASEINAPGWLNNMIQNARGGKLVLSFFFTSDGPPGLHGCLLKLDRVGEYMASLVDARFPKRSDAKAAVCLQAMSEGIGDYIRSIASALEAKVTPTMRSFSSGLVFHALATELGKINADLHPYFEYDKERDAFGSTLVVRLSTSPTPEEVRRYTVGTDYRNKADAKVAVICHAAKQGVVEFIRFRGGAPPAGYVSPYNLRTYDPETSRKRKPEVAEHSRPTKKRKGKERAVVPVGQYSTVYPSGNQIHGFSQPGDMGLLQSVPTDSLCDPSQPGVGGGGGSGAAHHTSSYTACGPSYPAMLDPRFAGGTGPSSRGHSNAYGSAPLTVDVPTVESGPSRAWPGTSARPPRDTVELEPGEVVSSAESEFSESSSRNEDGGMPGDVNDMDRDNVNMEVVRTSKDKGKGKGKEKSPENLPPNAFRDDPTTPITASHVEQLIDYCATHGCGKPSFHGTEQDGRFQVWIVIDKERFELPKTYLSAEEGRERVSKQVLARLTKCR